LNSGCDDVTRDASQCARRPGNDAAHVLVDRGLAARSGRGLHLALGPIHLQPQAASSLPPGPLARLELRDAPPVAQRGAGARIASSRSAGRFRTATLQQRAEDLRGLGRAQIPPSAGFDETRRRRRSRSTSDATPV